MARGSLHSHSIWPHTEDPLCGSGEEPSHPRRITLLIERKNLIIFIGDTVNWACYMYLHRLLHIIYCIPYYCYIWVKNKINKQSPLFKGFLFRNIPPIFKITLSIQAELRFSRLLLLVKRAQFETRRSEPGDLQRVKSLGKSYGIVTLPLVKVDISLNLIFIEFRNGHIFRNSYEYVLVFF